jgi:hypothetical protein
LFKRFAFWFTFASAAICIYNYLGYDRDNFLVTMISIPVWILEIFEDTQTFNPIVIYALTVGSWLAYGLILDAGLRKGKVSPK